MKKNLLALAKVVVTLVLVFWLVNRVDWRGVGQELSQVSWAFLVLYVIFQIAGNLISAKKWQIIASYKDLHFTLKEAFFTYMTGAFINNFLPSTIGGDAYRGLWLAKRSGARTAALSTVVFDRFIGLWTTALLALVLSFTLWSHITESWPLFITLAILFGFLVVDLVVIYLYCRPWFQEFVVRISFHQLRRLLEEIIFYTKKHIWLRTSLWSSLFIFVGIGLSNYTLFHALGSDIAFLPFLATIFLVAIVASIPISINNIGIKEWAYVVFFGLIGVSVETAVTAALLSRFIQLFLSFIALPQYLST
ncbi:MAG: lysylphosphatidylglycerol synthase transmembrane domain-containing protein, partial [Candidatus Moranbacteria bacterium]|nr:lysylphosphatidylglycerol synthase transmembrane domain-containing protein [Candidatus Moranbacteria bacterium]